MPQFSKYLIVTNLFTLLFCVCIPLLFSLFVTGLLLFIGAMGSTGLCFYGHCVVMFLLQMITPSSGINVSLTLIALAISSVPGIIRINNMDKILIPLFLRF